MNSFFISLISLVSLFTLNCGAACFIKDSSGQQAKSQFDPLYSLLSGSKNCPQNVQMLKQEIEQVGLGAKPFMVANRGINNPAFGSFSFFEEVTGWNSVFPDAGGRGEFFFGHFTAAEQGIVVADQMPSTGKLMIELIVWDHAKLLFNFYELIGTGSGGQWFYRGDSANILADNQQLYLGEQSPQFGTRLRCSGCHLSGGPIMKEMALPHNDWWTNERPLEFAPNQLSQELAPWVQKLGDADEMSQSVKTGTAKLENSATYQRIKSQTSLQIALRPLFCETEINLESDLTPFESSPSRIQVASASIVSPMLAQAKVEIEQSQYARLLNQFGMSFPETMARDADHAWLVPVKGHADLAAIENLIASGQVTAEFASDVLAVDMQHPVLSEKRCGLLKLLPSAGLTDFLKQPLNEFKDALKKSGTPESLELFQNLTDPRRDQTFHANRAMRILSETRVALSTASGSERIFQNLMASRQAVFKAEISKNPRGQIFEPGFRVIFPEPNSR